MFLVAGSAGHDALDTYYRTGLLDSALGQLRMTWQNMGGEAFDLAGEWLNLQHMERVLANYVNNFRKDAYEPIYLVDLLGNADMASEAEVMVDFPEVSMPVKMILDRVMKHVNTGRLEVWDTKFTAAGLLPYSAWAPPPDEKYMLSYQIPLYATGWRELTGLDIQAGKIEAIYMGKGKQHQPGEVRPITIFDRWDEEIREGTLGWVQDRIDEMEFRREKDCWPQLDGSLERQYICNRCQFRRLCEARPSAREGLIQIHYQEREKR